MKTNLIILLLCLNFWANAQESKVTDITAQGIKIGEKVPDDLIPNVSNYKTTSFKLSDFRGKWVIIDFWATWCGACINMKPTMQKLSTQFEDKLAFISVTYETEAEIKPFFDRQKVKAKSNIPEVIADELIHKWFPHRLLPHYVWIDPNGIVKAITGPEEINEGEVTKAIYEQASKLKMRRELVREFDENKGLQYYVTQDTSINIKMQSLLTGYMLGVISQYGSYIQQDKFSILCTNTSLFYLYRIANSYPRFLSSKMVEFEVSDKNKLTSPLKGSAMAEWRVKNSYCYQVSVPNNKMSTAYSKMKEDLNQAFPMYKATLVKKDKPCLVLEVVGDTSLLRPKGEKPFIEFNDWKMILKNAKLSAMIDRLTKYVYGELPPVFLQEGLDGRVDLEINANLRNIDSVNKQLEKYGLALVTRNRIQEVLVISDVIVKN